MRDSAFVVNAYSKRPLTAPASPHGDATIRLSNISKFYSGVPALRDVSVEFYAGEVHAILGENGAGKSTLMNIISGAVQPELGEIWLSDRRISHMSPEVAASLGIAISFQHPAILDDLSVLENLQVVGMPAKAINWLPAYTTESWALRVCAFPIGGRWRSECGRRAILAATSEPPPPAGRYSAPRSEGTR